MDTKEAQFPGRDLLQAGAAAAPAGVPWGRLARGGAIGLGAMGAMNLVSTAGDAARRTSGRDKAFAKFVQEFPDIVQQDPAYSKRVFDSLFRSAPFAAKDPLVAAHFVRSAVERKSLGADIEGLDPATMKSVIDIDTAVTQARRGGDKHPLSMLAGMV